MSQAENPYQSPATASDKSLRRRLPVIAQIVFAMLGIVFALETLRKTSTRQVMKN